MEADKKEIIKKIGNTTIHIKSCAAVHTPEQVEDILYRIMAGAQQALSAAESKRPGAQNDD